jgi:hypothetical protein
MTRMSPVIAAAVCIFLAGCPTRSLSPLFTQDDISFNAELIGTWKNVKDPDVLTIQKSGDKGYTIIVREKNGDSSSFKMELGRLGGYWFMDSQSAAKYDDYHVLPTHMIWRLWLANDTMRIASLEGDWLKQMIDARQLDIQHAVQNGDIVLTASTEELQKFVLQYADNASAFPKPDLLVRAK